MGFTKPTSIQTQTIPLILADKDLIACAQTGTGKTAAFVLPILNKIIKDEVRHLNTIIIAPTRELAQQIDQQIEGFSYFLDVSSIPVYGGGDGHAWEQQKRALNEGADMIIATPGRLLSMLSMTGKLNLSHVKHIVLDEADRMLDMGFYDDIMKIIQFIPNKPQIILFSATMPPKIRTLAEKILIDPVQVNIDLAKPKENINQQAYMVYDSQKNALLIEILKDYKDETVIIFASTKDKVKLLNRDFQRAGLSIKAFHSDLYQSEREHIMRLFKSKEVKMLIGTDILSRGIDVDGISLVVNYDVPPDPEDYVHRIGRTARADKSGTAITFITPKDQYKFLPIEQLLNMTITKNPVPEKFGEAPVYNPGSKPKFNGKPSFKKKTSKN
jgi:superfamily II DNA/RNA helicase